MKKKVFGRKLSRESATRKALFRGLVKALVEKDVIETTKAKAKAIQPMVDKLTKLARSKEVSARRKLYASLANDRKTVDLFVAKAINFQRTSGFTRITNLIPRKGDNAEMVRMEWVDKIEIKKESNKENSDKSKEKENKTKRINDKSKTKTNAKPKGKKD